MYKVYLNSGYDFNPEEAYFLGEANTQDEAFQIMTDSVMARFTQASLPLYRYWQEDNKIWVDFGSWSDFVVIIKEEEIK